MTVLNKVSNKSLMTGVTPIADVPDAPTIGTATDVGTSRAYNNGSATVAYTAAATGGAATTFTATSTPGSFTATGSSPITVTGLQSATAYTFTVRPSNASATGPASSASSSITATTVPDAPTMGTPTVASAQAYTGNANVSVPFTAPATGGKTISTYTVTSSSGGTATGSASPVTISDVVGTARTYTVTATNANGTGSASSASASTTPLSVPQAPTIGTATDGGTGTTVTVAYTAGATGGAAVSAYTATSSPGGFTGTGASPITVSGLTAGTAYTFTVTATNAQGTSAASSASNSVTPVVPSSFFLISQQVLGSSASTVTFSSIPNTYKSLQIRSIARNTTADTYVTQMGLNLNSDSGTNYSLHYLYGNGGAVTAGGYGTSFGYAYISGTQIDNYALANTYGASIIDIVDYTLSKNKTIKYISGVNINNTTDSSNQITLGSSVWLNTSAVTTVSITAAQNSFAAGSTFSLYGVS